jgi:type IV secretion system protein VirB5
MALPLQDAPPNFKPETQIKSAFHKGQTVWDNRLGNSRIQAKNWRIYALIAMSLNFVLAIGLTIQSLKSNVEPMYVRINGDSSTEVVAPRKVTYAPQQPEIEYFIQKFVMNIRSVPLDVVMAKKNYTEAYAYLTNVGAQQLQQMFAKTGDNPASKLGQSTINVTIKSVLAQTKDTYQVQWIEDNYDLTGNLIESNNMTGLFTLMMKLPATKQELMVNPLGIYLKNITWSKDLVK